MILATSLSDNVILTTNEVYIYVSSVYNVYTFDPQK